MRLLYIHAFQAFIWNSIISRRVKEFGLKPIVGDLVLCNDEETNNENDEIKAEDAEEERDQNEECVELGL